MKFSKDIEDEKKPEYDKETIDNVKHHEDINPNSERIEIHPKKSKGDTRYPEKNEASIHNDKHSNLNPDKIIMYTIKPKGEDQEIEINPIFQNVKNKRNIKNGKKKIINDNIIEWKKKKKKFIIISAIVFLAIVGLIIGLCLGLLKKTNKNKDDKNYQEEKLIVKMNYIPNNLLQFRSKKNIYLEANANGSEESDSNSNKNNKKNMTQYTDFIFIIREKKDEKDENSLIKKNLYTGYIGIINVTLNNGTNDMMVVYDDQLSKSIKNEKQNNLRNIDEKPDISYVDEKNKLCFTKIESYENAEI